MSTNYYWKSDTCNHCGRSDQPLHVGMSAGGWKFTFRGYNPEDYYDREVPHIESWQHWKEFLRAQTSGTLVNEYGDAENVGEFISAIDQRQANDKLRNHGGRYPCPTTTLDSEGNTICFHEFS